MNDKNVVYREEQDILHLNVGGRSRESVPRGGFIIDLDSKGKVVGVELLDASDMFQSLEVEDVEQFLSNIVDADIIMKKQMDILWVILKLHSVIEGEKIEETFRFEVPHSMDSAETVK